MEPASRIVVMYHQWDPAAVMELASSLHLISFFICLVTDLQVIAECLLPTVRHCQPQQHAYQCHKRVFSDVSAANIVCINSSTVACNDHICRCPMPGPCIMMLAVIIFIVELCAAAPPPTECRRRAGAVFVKCSRHVVHQLYVAGYLKCRLQWIFNIDKKQ